MNFQIYNTPRAPPPPDNLLKKYIWRNLNGESNNLNMPSLGMSNTNLIRVAETEQLSAPNPRTISDLICYNPTPIENTKQLSNMTWIFGQFIDHMIVQVHTDPTRPDDIKIPSDASAYPNYTIPFNRSLPEQPNSLSAFIDGTAIYGSENSRSLHLRRLDGSGELRLTAERLLPYNTDNFPNEDQHSPNPSSFFIAGDTRVNENVFLTAIHTLFAREHNYQCSILKESHPTYKEELLFQHAKKMVVGEIQHILWEEFLPVLVGPVNTSSLNYDSSVDPSIATEFSTVGFRIGHGMIPSNVDPTRPLRDLFFNPQYVASQGIEAILQNAMNSRMKEIDGTLVEDLRTFLFGPPSQMKLLDLAALNIQRARDHQIPTFNQLRQAYGLPQLYSFAQITSNPQQQQNLEEVYSDIDSVDPWIGAILEDHCPGGVVGPTIKAILVEQFTRLRKGDRFWYDQDQSLTAMDRNKIKHTSLSDIIKRNTTLTEVPSDVFHTQR